MSYNFDPHAEITWLEDYQAVHVKWKRLYMSLERFHEICIKAMSILIEHNGVNWIADQYESEGAFNKEIQETMNGEMYVQAQKAGIKLIMVILPKAAGLSSLSTKRWVKSTSEREDMSVDSFATLEECLAWLKDAIQQENAE